jgi:opacity protein-like surface antigen
VKPKPGFLEIPKVKRTVLTLVMLTACCAIASGQALPAAARAGDLQLGGTFTYSSPDYTTHDALGYGIYGDFDFTQHYGASIAFHHTSISQITSTETTYEIGARYHRVYGIYRPYVKLMVGRGIFNFGGSDLHSNPGSEGFTANQSGTSPSSNFIAGAGGVDFAVTPRINVRVEGEYQKWGSNTQLGNGLSPILLNVGAAYHFNAGWPR